MPEKRTPFKLRDCIVAEILTLRCKLAIEKDKFYCKSEFSQLYIIVIPLLISSITYLLITYIHVSWWDMDIFGDRDTILLMRIADKIFLISQYWHLEDCSENLASNGWRTIPKWPIYTHKLFIKGNLWDYYYYVDDKET